MVDFTTPHVDDAGKKGDYYNYGCASVLHRDCRKIPSPKNQPYQWAKHKDV